MRVAILSMHTSPLAPLGGREAGGMNVYVRQVAAHLARSGVSVDVFTRRTDVAAPEVQRLTAGARLVHIAAGPPEPIEKEDLAGHVAEFAAGIEAFRAREGLAYDVIHSHYWLAVEAGAALARRWNGPHLAMFHTLGDVKLRARASEHERPARLEAERRLMHTVDHIVVATEHERRLLKQLYRVQPQRVSVMPLGVDLDRFTPLPQSEARAAIGLPDHGPSGERRHVVLSVGRIEPLKGFDILVRSLAEMTERNRVTLLIAGGDERAAPEVARLRAIADEVGVADRVRFVGAVPHESLHLYYNAADVVAVPSFYESFGLVAVEAMACGVPVVASRVGGLTSTVADGRTGYLIPWRCPGPFAEKLDLLLGNDSLRHALGAAAARSMRAYSWGAVSTALLDLYQSLASTQARSTAAGEA